jgi:hypothetical protein
MEDKLKRLKDEHFEDLKGFECFYMINKNGDLWSKTQLRICKRQINDSGYQHYVLKNGYISKALIHRLLSIQYIPNLENLPEVDHIDRNKLNNSLDNLRWVTRCENRANRITKGSVYSWVHKKRGKTYWKATYAIEKGNIKQKSFNNKEDADKWLENIKSLYPRL